MNFFWFFSNWCSTNIHSPFILKPEKLKLQDTALRNTFLVPKNILENWKINKSVFVQSILVNKTRNEQTEKAKQEYIKNYKISKLSLFFPIGSEKDDFNKSVDLKTYLKEENIDKKIKFSKKLNISKNKWITTYYQFVNPQNIAYYGLKFQKLPILWWYKVYEKECKSWKIYWYLYLWNYKTLNKALEENTEEIKKWDIQMEEKNCVK